MVSSPKHQLRHILDRAEKHLLELTALSDAASDVLVQRDAETLRKVIAICELGLSAISDQTRRTCLVGIEKICAGWKSAGFSPEFAKFHAIANIGALDAASNSRH